MKPKKLLKRKNSKRGISLVECVIAITLVTIFSLSAISVSTLASSQTAKSMHSFAAASLCNDVRQCFTVTNSPDELQKALTACGYPFEVLGESNANDAITLKFDRKVFQVTVYVTYSTGTQNMVAKATREGKDGILYEMQYTAPRQEGAS